MEKLRPKRNNLLKLVDRLHVEKTISKTLEDNPSENLIDQFLNPILLKNPKDDVLTVNPGFGSKISRRVYMLRRSRTTEGGSKACELCGHLSFKLFSITVETMGEGKRQTPSQWRRTQTEVVKVCRTCYTEHNSKEQQGTRKAGHKNNTRPNFERSFCGITTDRASTSWHFLRRDITKTKTQALVNHHCYETEFSDKYLKSGLSDSEVTSDSDTCYEDSDSEGRSETLTFQLASKGWVSPTSLTSIKMIEGMDCKPLPISAVKSDVTLDMILDAELAMTRSNSACVSPLSSSVSSKIHSQAFKTAIDSHEKILELLTNSLETPLEVIKEENDLSSVPGQSFVDNLLGQGLIDYFTDQPARVRRLKRKHLNKTDGPCTKKPKVEIVKSKPSLYGGLCNLVTVVNPKKGGNIVNPSTSTLYDTEGFEWRKKDLPVYLNMNTNKYINSKMGYRQRKKEIDSFLTETKPKAVIKFKPSPHNVVVVDENEPLHTSQFEISVSDVMGMENEKTEAPAAKNLSEEVITPAVLMDKENVTVQMGHVEPKKKELSKTTIEKVTEKKNDDEDDDDYLATIKVAQAKVKKERPVYRCLACNDDLTRKSYFSFTRDTAPLILIKHFIPSMSRIRICKGCFSKKQKEAHGFNEETTRKRAKPSDGESSPIPSKIIKSNAPKISSPSIKQTTQPKIKIQTPPKKSVGHSPQSKKRVKAHPVKKSDDAANVTFLNNQELQQLTSSSNTQYVIVKAGSSLGAGSVQKLSTVVALESDQASSDITINGKNYKIDSEFKLNELVKDNENAVLSNDVQKDILSQLPNILKRTIGQQRSSQTAYKIVNVLHNGNTSSATNQCTKILPKPSTHVTTSLPSISLQIKEQLNSLPKGLLQPQVSKMKTSNSLPTNGPVKPIQLVNVPRVTTPNASAKKRPVFTSPLNTPLPPKAGGGMLSPNQKQNIVSDDSKDSTKAKI